MGLTILKLIFGFCFWGQGGTWGGGKTHIFRLFASHLEMGHMVEKEAGHLTIQVPGQSAS